MRQAISVAILTRNAGPEFRLTLEMISRQKVDAAVDVLVVDSESTDETLDLCREFGVPVVSVTPQSFNHGLTRNFAVSKTTGEFVALIVQDAVPADEHWLSRMVQHLDADPRVAGVTGRQVPRSDAEIVARWELLYHFAGMGEGRQTKEIHDLDDFRRLTSEKKFYTCSFDNVASMIRRAAWETIPFRRIAFAEDLDWGYRTLKARHRLVYDPLSIVVHSHNRPAVYHLRRHYVSSKVVPGILECEPIDYSREDDASMFAQAMALAAEVADFIRYVGHREETLSQVELQRLLDSFRAGELDPGPEADDAPPTPGRVVRPLEAVRSSLLRIGLDVRPQGRRLRSRLSRLARGHRFREHFYFVTQAVLSRQEGVTGSLVGHVALHVLARTVGAMLGDYYYWCHCRNQVSPELAGADAWLSVGI
jgi:rhamnosyltransferase